MGRQRRKRQHKDKTTSKVKSTKRRTKGTLLQATFHFVIHSFNSTSNRDPPRITLRVQIWTRCVLWLFPADNRQPRLLGEFNLISFAFSRVQIYSEIQAGKVTTPLDLDLPGSGQFICVHCAYVLLLFYEAFDLQVVSADLHVFGHMAPYVGMLCEQAVFH
jgi:hypothetical protein